MNINEAKAILLLYRPGAGDEADPQIAEALALAQENAELGGWLADHCARQEALRGKLRQIAPPPGLKEQIISEQAARGRAHYWRPRMMLAGLAVVLVFLLIRPYLPEREPDTDTVAVYEAQMADWALRGYGMDLRTNDAVVIRAFLAQTNAPADFAFSSALQKTPLAGCAIGDWNGTKVSMVCFRTGRAMPPKQETDMWLFVAERKSFRDAPAPGQPQITVLNHLTEALWTQGDRVYLLGLQGDESTLRKFL